MCMVLQCNCGLVVTGRCHLVCCHEHATEWVGNSAALVMQSIFLYMPSVGRLLDASLKHWASLGDSEHALEMGGVAGDRGWIGAIPCGVAVHPARPNLFSREESGPKHQSSTVTPQRRYDAHTPGSGGFNEFMAIPMCTPIKVLLLMHQASHLQFLHCGGGLGGSGL